MARLDPIILWPDGAPGAVGSEDEDIPTLTPYLPEQSVETGAAVVVCPGGGYAGLAPHEAEPVALWLNSIGVVGFVLKYRLAPRYHHPAMLQDAARAIRTVRCRAGEWGVGPEHVGILGFSAGGHLTSTAVTHYDSGQPDGPDAVERFSSRPDFGVLIYPVISLLEFTHGGSRVNLLGEDPPEDLVWRLSSELQVTPDTPPCFIVHSVADSAVPVENALLFAEALRRAGVPFSLHVYELGEHGYGLGGDDPVLSTWPSLCEGWLRKRGMLGGP
ncbi:MAG: alpha/beta hydrolase [Acidobacteriota bacterium]|jgi:acetyl esterase/lipase|nr:alpha/beta hydrolase [Acidobacteriota bacterium]